MKKLFTACIVLAFVLVLLPGLYWALMPMLAPPQGIHNADWSSADLILDRCAFCVVNPKKLDVPEDEVYFKWVFSEIKARGLIVIVPWSLVLGITIWLTRKKRTANNELESTVA